MDKNLIQSKYGKPKQLSDPYQDFNGEEDKLLEIVEKTDFDITLHDFSWIFQMHLPAAAYEEGLYYIPLCFEYMMKACPLEENVCNSLFWYIGHFKDRLLEDGFYQDCLQESEKLFDIFTNNFVVINEYTPNPKYRLSKLKYGESIQSLVYGATQSEETWEILSKHFFGLKDKGEVGSCWWIMISYFVRDRICYAQKRSYGYKYEKLLFEHFHKFGEYSKHWEKAMTFTKEKKTYYYLPQFAIIPFELAK